MADTRTITVSLPEDIVRWAEEQVAAGSYASTSDVVRHGIELAAQLDHPETPDDWLVQDVLPVLDACSADPTRLVSSDDVKRRIDALHQESTEARGRAA